MPKPSQNKKITVVALLLMAVSGSGWSQQGSSGGTNIRAMATAKLTLLESESVQQELGLSPDQVRSAKGLAGEFQAEVRAKIARTGFDSGLLEKLSPEERLTKLRELAMAGSKVAQDVERNFRTKLDLLLEPEQNARLAEIQVQAMGISALTFPDVGIKLNLSPEQKKKLEELEQEYRRQTTAQFQKRTGNSGVTSKTGGAVGVDFAKVSRENREQHEKKMSAVLTEAQQTAFRKMKGRPFNLSLLRPRSGAVKSMD